MRLLRSVLFVPGTRPDRFARALASGADAVVFDLEDSVDAGRKTEARKTVRDFFAGAPGAAGGAAPLRLVRTNGVGTTWLADDLGLVRGLDAIDGIVLPKAETSDEVEDVARGITPCVLCPLVETARGILNAAAIAASKAPVAAILFGAEDLTSEIGIARTVSGEELLYARSHVVLAATAAGVDAIDAVFIDLAAPDALRADALRARALGFRGKMAIHPDQVPIINEVFTPTADEIARARRIIEASEAAAAQGEGVIRLDDQMIDAPVVARARRVIRGSEVS
jgi:citrate lyase subunit beta/citryl-CoA lyase